MIPPDWLPQARLPLTTLPASDRLVRIHRLGKTPIFFSPGERQPPAGRFDSASGRFGVIYMAQNFDGAFAETPPRNPARRLVAAAELAARACTLLAPSRDLRLVRPHGAGLQALGLDNAITTGPYEPCGMWSDALFDHTDRPDGIAYASHHDPDQLCMAMFSRPDIIWTPDGPSVALSDRPRDVAAALRRYGKGLEA
jgi:hypothetical protein